MSLDAACFIFVIRTSLIGRDGCRFALGNECRKIDSFKWRATRQSVMPLIVNVDTT
jgi:hypothetical protein